MQTLRNVNPLIAAIGLCFLLAACEKKASETEKKMSAAEPESVAAMPEPKGKPQKVIIGIAECDAFLEKYRACLDRLPKSSRDKMKNGLERTEQAWLKESKDSAKHEEIKSACVELDGATATAMKAQGCRWN